MPNLRAISLADGLHLVASDGRVFDVTRAQVLVHFQTETGTVAQRVAKTVVWLKTSVEAALGREQVDASLSISSLAFDRTTGRITGFEVVAL